MSDLASHRLRGGPVQSGKIGRVGQRSIFCRPRAVSVRSEQVQRAPVKEEKRAGLVVAVGESLFDLIADQQGLSRERVKSWTPFAGGAPANVATSLGKLGQEVLLITALGKDKEGEQMLQLFKDSGVRLDGVQRREEPTRDVYVVRDKSGDREFAGFGRPTEEYCDAHLDSSLLPVEEIKGASILITGTLGLAYPDTRLALQTAVKAAREGGCKVMVDVNWRPVFWGDADRARAIILEYLQEADILKISDAELEWLLKIPLATALINPCAVVEKFPKASGVLLTAGGEGAAYCFTSAAKGSHSGFVPVFKVDVEDTTGAGDAFTSGFVYKLLEAGSLEALAADPVKLKQAIVFASATGALTCTKKGAIEGQPTLPEVVQLSEQSKTWHNFW